MATKINISGTKNTQGVYSFKMLINSRWRKIATAESWKSGTYTKNAKAAIKSQQTAIVRQMA